MALATLPALCLSAAGTRQKAVNRDLSWANALQIMWMGRKWRYWPTINNLARLTKAPLSELDGIGPEFTVFRFRLVEKQGETAKVSP